MEDIIKNIYSSLNIKRQESTPACDIDEDDSLMDDFWVRVEE